MSTRWIAAQYVGDTLRLPVVSEGDMDKPFGSSVLERDVKRIVVNPFSDSPQTFVPELENRKLRELVKKLVTLAFVRCADCDLLDASCSLVPAQKCLLWNECESIARELGIEVEECTTR